MNSVKTIQELVRKSQELNVYFSEQNLLLSEKIDDLEQYGRRRSLRMYGVSPNDMESGEDVRKLVLQLISDANINVLRNFVDRAHRIGKVLAKDVVKKTLDNCSFQ